MAKREVKTTLALDGETKLKDAIKSINKEYSVLKSEMSLVTAQFGKNNQSVEKLQAVNEVLNKEIDVQGKKVAELANGLDQAKAAYGENSDQAKNYEIQLNNAKATLAKMENELRDNEQAIEDQGKEAAQAADKIEDHAEETKDAEKNTKDWGGALSKTGSFLGGAFVASAAAAAAAVAAITAATVAAIKGLSDMTAEAGEWADELITVSNQTGVAQETLQGLEYASRFVDVSVDDMTKGMSRLVREMGTAQKAGNDYIEVSDGIKLSLTGTNGELKSTEELFYESIDLIGSLENETKKEIAAQEMFGRSYQDIMPLIKAGSQSLKDYTAEAAEMGYILENEQIAKLGEYDDLMQKTDAQMDSLKRQLALNFLPTFQAVGSEFSVILSEMGKALSDGFQPEDISTIGAMISEKLIAGIAKFAEYVPQIVTTISSALTEAVNVVVALLPELLPVLMDGALQLVQGVLDAIKNNLGPLMDMVVTVLMQLVQFFVENLPMVIEIGIEILLALVNGLVAAIPELIPVIIQAVMTIVDTLLNNLGPILSAGIELLLALTFGIINAIPELAASIPRIISTIVTVLIDNLPMIISAAVQIIIALIAGLISAIPEIVMMMPKIIMSIIEAFKNTDWGALGKSIIEGIVNGLKNAGGLLVNAAKNAAKSALGAIKKTLGINSPSRVFRDEVGFMMGEGIADGLDRSGKDIDKALDNVIPDLEGQYGAALTVGNGTVRHSHSGTIRIEGVNDSGQLIGVVDVVMDRLRMESMLAGG